MKGFFQIEIILNVLVIFFHFIWKRMVGDTWSTAIINILLFQGGDQL